MHKLPILLGLILMAFVISWARKSADWNDDAQKRKAEFIFMEAQNRYGLGDLGDYVMLSNRAYELDSTDLDIGYEWGMVMLANKTADSVSIEQAYQKVKKRFFTSPDDYVTGITFANLARRMNKFDDMLMAWQTLDSLFPASSQPAQEMANSYLYLFLMGDSTAFGKAMNIFNRLEEGAGKNINLSSQKMQAFMIKKDTLSLIKEVEALVSDAPKDSYTAFFAGMNYEYIGMKEKALEQYNRACELDSTYGPAFMAKANLYNQMGDSVAFDREVFKALKSQNLDIEPKLEILRSYVSELYNDKSQEPRIRELFGELELMHAGEPMIHNLFASYLYTVHDYDGAAEQLTYSLALNPNDEESWVMLVQLLVIEEDTEQIINYAKEAGEKFPQNLYFPIAVANGYKMKDDVASAIAAMDSVKIDKINNPQAVSNFKSYLGDLNSLYGDTARAISAYEEAIALDPENYLALNNAAYFMAENNIDLDKAEQYASRVVRNVQNNPTYLDTYAWVFFKKKDYAMARNYIDMTLNIYGFDEPADSVVADYGDVQDEQVETVSEDLDMMAPSSEVYEHAGDIYFMNGEPDRAVEFWEKALALEPENERLGRKVKHKTYFYK